MIKYVFGYFKYYSKNLFNYMNVLIIISQRQIFLLMLGKDFKPLLNFAIIIQNILLKLKDTSWD